MHDKRLIFKFDLHPHMITTYKTNLRNYNKILRQSIRSAECFRNINGDMKTAWQNINNILNKTKTKKQFPEKFKFNAQLLTDTFGIVNQFNIFFVNIGTKCIENIVTPPNKSYKDYLTSPCETSFNFTPVTEDDINIIILKLNSKMSSGRDGISNTILKATMPIISKQLTLIKIKC